METKTGQGKKWLKLFIILLVTGIFIAALYFWVILDAEKKFEEITGGEEITSSELALTVLNINDTETALNLKGSLRPQLTQFNGPIFTEDIQKFGYKDLVGKNTINKFDGTIIVDNAVLLFDTTEEAEKYIETVAAENNAQTTRSFEGEVLTLVLTGQGDETSYPYSTMRFVVGNLGARITVYGGNSVIDYQDTSLITTEVMNLATVQKEKMEKLLAGEDPGSVNVLETNMAMNNFPDELEGATFLGKTFLDQEEWLGETLDTRDAIPGFVSGAYGSFFLSSADQSLDVVIMEFEEPEDASNELDLFLTTGANIMVESEEIDLPDSLSSFSLGRVTDGLAEIQAVDGVYLYDIAILPGNSELDKEEAVKNLIEFSEKILN